MDAGTSHDMIEDMMVELAVARASLEWMTMERDRLSRLVRLFEAHYECEHCAQSSATYLEDCMNPLHALHDAVYGLGNPNE